VTGPNPPSASFRIEPHYAVSPYQVLEVSKTGEWQTGASFLKGNTAVESGLEGIVDFSKVFFTNRTSELPHSKLHLLVISSDPRISPFLLRDICVRSKRVHVREDLEANEPEHSPNSS